MLEGQGARTVIFAGADIPDYEWLKGEVDSSDTLICADSGLRHAHAIGLKPDIIIGDLDSVDVDILNQYQAYSKIMFDDNQNATDLMKALSLCDWNKPVHLYGATGGRADHDFSNILILMNLEHSDDVVMVSKGQTSRVIKHNCIMHGEIGDYVGLFPLSPVQDFAVQGLMYTPDVLGGPYEFGWNGSCNLMTDKRVLISLSSGALLVTHTKRH